MANALEQAQDLVRGGDPAAALKALQQAPPHAATPIEALRRLAAAVPATWRH